MKKGFYAILAALAVFALVMTGCDTGGGDPPPPPPPTTVTITFEVETPNGITFDRDKVPSVETINSGASLGNKFPADLKTSDLSAASGSVPSNIGFLGWYDGTTPVDSATTFSSNKTITGKFGVTITISFKYETNNAIVTLPTAPDAVKIAVDSSLGAKLPDGAVIDDAIDWVFDAWYNGTTEVLSTTTFSTDTELTGKWKADTRIKITFKFTGDNPPADKIVKLGEGQSFESANKPIPASGTKAGYWFGYWYSVTLTNNEVKITNESGFYTNTEINQKWYKATLDADNTAFEKLSLENAALAIYKFDIGTAKLEDFPQIQVTYKVSEAAFNVTQTRHRVYGPFGTFASQANTTDAEEFDATNIDGWQEDENHIRFLNAPKFNVNSYISVNGGRDINFTNSDTGLTNNLVSASTTFAPESWFTLKYVMPTKDPGPGNVVGFEYWAHKGDTGVFYFGLGQTTNGGTGRDSYGNLQESGRSHWPIEQMVKDIKLVHKDNLDSDNTYDPNKDISATIPGATEAQFMAYGSPLNQAWVYRGNQNSTVVLPTPEKPPAIPPATEDVTLTQAADIRLYKYGGNATSLSSDFLTATVATTSNEGTGFYVSLPQLASNTYTTVTITYNATINSPNIAKVGFKKGADSWTDINGDNSVKYGAVVAGNGQTWSFSKTALDGMPTDKPGISFQVNNYDTADNTQNWTFTITKIELLK